MEYSGCLNDNAGYSLLDFLFTIPGSKMARPAAVPARDNA